MVILHPLSDFIDGNAIGNLSPSYYYQGHCPQTGELLSLPRTGLVEAIASGLMQHLAKDSCYSREGKMYGVLLVELPTGEQRVLKAVSGLLKGVDEGWVPSIEGRELAQVEAYTLVQLAAIKQELITLQQLPERQHYKALSSKFEVLLQAISDRHRDCKQQRHKQRQLLSETLTGSALTVALEQLNQISRQQKIERRQFKRQQQQLLQPLQQLIAVADARMCELKQQRQALSGQLQVQMHAIYSLTNFSGRSLSLQQLIPGGMPTGTGDCCAPKLLHYAATHGLQPLAMAEFWWGASSTNQDKVQGKFYEACAERCQPLMGFLLSGLPLAKSSSTKQYCCEMLAETLPILYEDEWLIAVDKPAGLLSVPGRYHDRQDSVLSRLRHLCTDDAIVAVHRLDQETSGILLLARDHQTHRHLSQQFQQRQVYKIYESVVAGCVPTAQGTIELPLWSNPETRPYQQVNWQRGKPSLTRFQVIATGDNTRVEFMPVTGRTHQLRVHAADSRGLGRPILGDRLYGCHTVANRLHLHARELRFEHPQSGSILHLQAKTPF